MHQITKRPNVATQKSSEIGVAQVSPCHEAFCNLQDWTPLHSAVSAGHTDIVQALISGGADVNAANSSGQTALHYAVSFVLLTWRGQHKQPSCLLLGSLLHRLLHWLFISRA